jgi:hypothetical protein
MSIKRFIDKQIEIDPSVITYLLKWQEVKFQKYVTQWNKPDMKYNLLWFPLYKIVEKTKL